MNDQVTNDLPADEPMPHSGPGQEVPPPKGILGRLANPAVRNQLLIFGGIVLVVSLAAFSALNRSSAPEQIPTDAKGVEALPTPGQMQEGPTALTESPAYKEVVEQVSTATINQAESEGRSMIPRAETLRAEPERTPQQMVMPESVVRAPGLGYQDPVMRDTQELQQQRDQIFNEQVRLVREFMAARQEAWAPRGSEIIGFGERSAVPVKAIATAATPATATTPTGTAATEPANQTVLIPAGTLVSATLVNRVNTDVQSPVVATIATGQFAGAKLIGAHVRAGEVAKIDFTAISIPGIGSMPAQAFTLDAATLDAGVASEVDRKIFERYVLRPTAAAIAAIGEAAQSVGSTTVTVAGVTQTNPEVDGRRAVQIGAGAVGEQVAKDFEARPTDPTVYVNRNTLVGVMFVADVVLQKR